MYVSSVKIKGIEVRNVNYKTFLIIEICKRKLKPKMFCFLIEGMAVLIYTLFEGNLGSKVSLSFCFERVVRILTVKRE